MNIERQPIKTEYRVNQIGHYKELIVGAGTKIFKANSAGVFIGSSSFGSAPFRVDYNGRLVASNAVITGEIHATSGEFTGSITATSGTFRGTIYAEAGDIEGDLTVSGSLMSDDAGYRTKLGDGEVKFYKNNTKLGSIRTASGNNGLVLATDSKIFFTDLAGLPNAELDNSSNLKFSNNAYIEWATGRRLTAGNSYISTNGDFIPASTNSHDLGTSGNQWNNIRGKYIHSSDGFRCGGSNGDAFNGYGFLIAIRSYPDGTGIQGKYAEVTVKGGIITSLSETGWVNQAHR